MTPRLPGTRAPLALILSAAAAPLAVAVALRPSGPELLAACLLAAFVLLLASARARLRVAPGPARIAELLAGVAGAAYLARLAAGLASDGLPDLPSDAPLGLGLTYADGALLLALGIGASAAAQPGAPRRVVGTVPVGLSAALLALLAAGFVLGSGAEAVAAAPKLLGGLPAARPSLGLLAATLGLAWVLDRIRLRGLAGVAAGPLLLVLAAAALGTKPAGAPFADAARSLPSLWGESVALSAHALVLLGGAVAMLLPAARGSRAVSGAAAVTAVLLQARLPPADLGVLAAVAAAAALFTGRQEESE